MNPATRHETLALYLLTAGLAILLHAALHILKISPYAAWGSIDFDGYMRLVRVTELQQTGAWFDGVIERANAPYGLAMHWTRPFDLLLLLGAWPLSLALGFDQALLHWGVWISPVLHVATGLVLFWALGPVLGNRERFLALALLLIQPVLAGFASAGRPDHHMLVLLLWVLAIGLTLRLVLRPQSPGLATALGAVLAVGLWVSIEFLLVMGALWSAWAVLWLLFGGGARDAVRQMGAFTAVVFLAVLAEQGPGGLLAAEYDRISVVHLLIGLLALAFWTAAAMIEVRGPRLSTRAGRLVFGLFGALVAMGLLYLTYPMFYGGPTAAMDPAVRALMFDSVFEAKSLWPHDQESFAEFLKTLGSGLVALPYLGVVLWRDRAKAAWPAWIVIAWMTAATFLAAGSLLRLAPFAEILLCLSAAAALGRLLDQVPERAPLLLRSVLRAGLVIAVMFAPLALGFHWSIAAESPPAAEPAPVVRTGPKCGLQNVTAALSRPRGLGARPRIILTHPYISAELIYRTPHSMVGPFFHRNTAGVSDTVAILGARDDRTARDIIARRGIEWILLCGDLETTDPAAFHSRLLAGHLPAWLRPIALDLPPEENFTLYQVVP